MASRSSKVISLSLAKGVLMLVHVVSSMVFARALTITDYGTYLQTFLAYDFAVPILTLGLPSALYYFLPGAEERKKGLVLDNLLLLFFAGLIFSLFLLMGGTELLAKRFNNPDLSKTLRWMVFYPLYTFPVLIGSAVWVTQDKVKLNAKYNVFTGLTLTITLIASVLLTRSYEAPILVRIFLPLAFLPVAIHLIFKYVPGDWDKPSLTSMWKMAKFAVPLGIASVLGTVTLQMANVIVSSLTSPEDFAIYANGAKEIPFIGIITGSISVVIMADMSKNIKEGDQNHALELFRKAARVSASFLFPIMCFLFLFADSFINVLYSSKYEASTIPFRIFLLMIPIRIAYYSSAYIALGKTKEILYRTGVGLVLTAVFCYLFVRWFGYNGAAIATIAVIYLWNIPYNLFFLSKYFKCKSTYILPLKTLGQIFINSLISTIASLPALFFKSNSLMSLTLGSILFSVVYIFIAYRKIDNVRLSVDQLIAKIKE